MNKNLFLPWQAYLPLNDRNIDKTGKAFISGNRRGTIILLSDYGAGFSPAVSLQLAGRGFAAVGYAWYLQPQTAEHFSAEGANAHARFSRNFNRAALSAFLQHTVLPEYPAPFYLLAQGAGALFALSAYAVFSSIISRMVAIAPVFSSSDYKMGGFYHTLMRLCGIFSYPSYGSAAQAQASFAYRAHLLNEANTALSPRSYKAMKLPCLLLIAGGGVNSAKARQLAENLRLADSISLPAATADFLNQETASAPHRQFWAAFDAFIPGSDMNAANKALEYATLL